MNRIWSRWFVILSIAFLLAITLPYLLAARAAGPGYVFGGFLLNPLDGNSYLAKMYEGWQGDWRFTLPYTAEAGKGSYLFLFYLLLGHAARLFHLPLVITFHLARLIATGVMLLALYRFLQVVLPDARRYNLAFALVIFGSGAGWLALPFGYTAADFWVAEAYPFLSAFTNPHFPLGLGLLVWILTPVERGEQGVSLFLAALVLSLVFPFAVVMTVVVLSGLLMWEIVSPLDLNEKNFVSSQSSPIPDRLRTSSPSPVADRSSQIPGRLSPVADPRSPIANRRSLIPSHWSLIPSPQSLSNLRHSATFHRLLPVLLGGAPLLFYEFWVTRQDPVLAGWNAQNITFSPLLWDLALSLSPALLLALPGAWAAWKSNSLSGRLVILWVALGLVLLYIPFALQRRFSLGIMIPLVCLAVLGISYLARDPTGEGLRMNRFWGLAALVFLLSLPTNLVLLFATGHGMQTHEPLLYLQKGERQALSWMAAHTPQHALVLAAPEMGLFIPAYTGRRVIYGHPFETVNASKEKAAVLEFFQHGGQPPSLLLERKVDYVFDGPREVALGQIAEGDLLKKVYDADGVKIYAVDQPASP